MAKEALNPITEAEALQMLGYTSRKHLRAIVRKEQLPVRFAKLNHTTYLYSKSDIELFINQKFAKQ